MAPYQLTALSQNLAREWESKLSSYADGFHSTTLKGIHTVNCSARAVFLMFLSCTVRLASNFTQAAFSEQQQLP
jgi:hypothetical protein